MSWEAWAVLGVVAVFVALRHDRAAPDVAFLADVVEPRHDPFR